MRDTFNQVLTAVNGVIWHSSVIFILLVVGILFTIWTKLGQWKSLSHGMRIIRGDFDSDQGQGTITHFQALSAALSATVGVGNIGGTALAISMGGPGALFWMWIVGILGMALKTVEVTVTMIFRKTSPDGSVQGGPMWVVANGLAEVAPKYKRLGGMLAGLFCVTLLIATFTGGLFFQAWNAANITQQFFGVPTWVVGIVLMSIVGAVIIGGIKRIGSVAGRVVPLMCAIYLCAAVYAILINFSQLPVLIGDIFTSAFSASSAQGAFTGGTFGAIFSIGMQRAFFSSEAGQGSSPIAHSAVKTDTPVREGIVAGLEPFIDTIIVCTLTGLVILLSGVWSREPDLQWKVVPSIQSEEVDAHGGWKLSQSELPPRPDRQWMVSDQVFCLVDATEGKVSMTQQVTGSVNIVDGVPIAEWQLIQSGVRPELRTEGLYIAYDGAALAAVAFDQAHDGLGKWLVTIATWLFGISTMIAWSYYGEQGVTFMFGQNAVKPYRVIFCLVIFISCVRLAQGRAELTNLSNLGTGVMLWVNIPITLIFASTAMKQYHQYFADLENQKPNSA